MAKAAKNQGVAGEMPTAEHQSHGEFELVDPSRIDPAEQPIGRAARNLTESRFEVYARQGLIIGRQLKAGLHLRALLHQARMEPRLVANLLSTGSGGHGPEFSARVTEARNELAACRKRLDVLWPVIDQVLDQDITAASWAESAFGHDQATAKRTGMATLRLALEAAANFFALD